MTDTHCHLDGEEFRDDISAVIERAREAGVEKIFLPAIDLATSQHIRELCAQHPGYLYPMAGLHPEEVRGDWREQLAEIKALLTRRNSSVEANQSPIPLGGDGGGPIAIGEVGLDFYWSREYEQEQLQAFEEQVRWSVETRLPLMIHCRRAQNEMVKILRRYEHDLPGGVFHCFTGNQIEARELLSFQRFVLGIGGVLTFKKSHLPDDLPAAVPLDRIVLETDSPYMAPVPHRGKRNEPAFVALVMQRLAEAYGISAEQVERQTNENVKRIFGHSPVI
ncbi:MAG: TatD family hydrolase [Prevotella sp.]|nr:TatD family hydrolase [Prevotella sp.]